MKALKDGLRLAFERPQDEHHHRSSSLALQQGRQSMLNYIQQARHLASCIVINPIDTVTRVYVFVTEINAGTSAFLFDAKANERWASAFFLRGSPRRLIKRRSRSRCVKTTPLWPRAWNFLLLYLLLKNMSMWRLTRSSTTPTLGSTCSRSRLSETCIAEIGGYFRCRKPGHNAVVCRAPAPVLTVARSDTSVNVADQQKTMAISRRGKSYRVEREKCAFSGDTFSYPRCALYIAECHHVQQ